MIAIYTGAYLAMVSFLRDKRGFKWKWFWQVTCAAWLVGMFIVPAELKSAGLDFSERRNGWLEMTLMTGFSLLMLPFPALMGIALDNIIPKNLPFYKRWMARGFIYSIALCCLFIVFGFVMALVRPILSPAN